MIDSNVVLDLFLFEDPRTTVLRDHLTTQRGQWLATEPMREELVRVLAYPHITGLLARRGQTAAGVLAQFDDRSILVPAALKAPYTCKDADDQKFIDLAVAHQAILVSKDKAVLCMANRLARLSAHVTAELVAPAVAQTATAP